MQVKQILLNKRYNAPAEHVRHRNSIIVAFYCRLMWIAFRLITDSSSVRPPFRTNVATAGTDLRNALSVHDANFRGFKSTYARYRSSLSHTVNNNLPLRIS